MKPAIEISQLGKKYRIGKIEPYLSLRDSFTKAFARKKQEDFWALENIDLSIEKGERIGIIGRNGAGKSTLLKILSRITWPTTGSAIIRGRLASLLEVGTGFHPELTGRENIYLNGSILGLKRIEITRQFDAIVDFSGVETFLDTPLKNYSSGMQLRLAFAVAAHLEPEILLVDEVLAVGDIEFQRKCLGKMEQVSKQQGRTVLFVSHNMAALRQLCDTGVLLEKGRLIQQGNIESTIDHYMQLFNNGIIRTGDAQVDLSTHPNKTQSGIGLLSASLYINDELSETFVPGSSLSIRVTYKIETPLVDPEIGVVIKDSNDVVYVGLNNKHIGEQLHLTTDGTGHAEINIPRLNIFAAGKYRIDLFFGDHHHFYECLYECFQFTVISHDVFESGILLNSDMNKIYIENTTIKAW